MDLTANGTTVAIATSAPEALPAIALITISVVSGVVVGVALVVILVFCMMPVRRKPRTSSKENLPLSIIDNDSLSSSDARIKPTIVWKDETDFKHIDSNHNEPDGFTTRLEKEHDAIIRPKVSEGKRTPPKKVRFLDEALGDSVSSGSSECSGPDIEPRPRSKLYIDVP